MKAIVNSLLIFLAIICAMELWVFNIGGLRIFFYEIIAIFIIGLILLYFLIIGKITLPKGPIRNVLLFYSLWFFLALLSYFLIDFKIIGSTEQYLKNFLSISIYIIFSIATILYLIQHDPEFIKKILKIYLGACIASAIYSVIEVTSAFYGFDLSKGIFSVISIGSDPSDEPFYYQWDIFFRAKGWGGIAVNGTYMLTAIPFLMITKPFDRQIINRAGLIICIIALFLTISKSAIVCFFMVLAVIFLRRPSIVLRGFFSLLIVISCFAGLFAFFYEPILILFESRGGLSGFTDVSGRIEVYIPILEAIAEHPFGYGLGQYFVHSTNANTIDFSSFSALGYSESQARIAYENTHSDWLNWLFEFGLLGVQVFILFYGWLVVKLAMMKTKEATALLAVILAIIISGFFHTIMSHFFIFFFTMISTLSLFHGQHENAQKLSNHQTSFR